MKIFGIYYKTVWRDVKTGYTIFTIKEQENKKEIISCAGYIPVYISGMPLMLIGEYKETKYGQTFHITITKECIKTEEAAIGFLSSGMVKGITRTMSQKIIKIFGSDIFELADKEDAELMIKSSIPRLSEEKIMQLVSKIKNEKQKADMFYFLQKYGASCSDVDELIKEYGNSSINKMKQNPYLICKKTNISFYVCDLIARDERVDPYDVNRIEALIREAMMSQLNSGDCYSTFEKLKSNLKKVIKGSAYPNDIPMSLVGYVLQTSKDYIIENDTESRIYFKFGWTQEVQAASHVNRLNFKQKKLYFKEDVINEIEKECGISYEDSQKKAFDILKSTGVKIVTGGPGTGKTTVINGIIHAYKKMFPNNSISLCAPTGRAAQRMTESTGMESVTIHKLLDFQPYGKEFTCKDKDNPIKSDFIVVDEFSMVDVALMSVFLNAVENGTLLLFVGDENQLPSVGYGAVMRDLIASEMVETYKLTEIFRQKETSPIIINAMKIMKSDNNFVINEDFEIIKAKNDKELIKLSLEYMKKNYVKSNPFKTQILCPVKDGESGVHDLNKVIQKEINDHQYKLQYGRHAFMKNDKIIMTRNNYELGYFNGDIGIVKDIYKESVVVKIQDNEIEIEGKNLDDIMLAYAMTIHKSQGSEYDNVLIVMPSGKTGININGLFTAVTRAKKKITIMYVGNGINNALNNKTPMMRNTFLKERLQKRPTALVPNINLDDVKIF